MKLTRVSRTAGWLAVAGLLGVALIAPAGAVAQSGNQTDVQWNASPSDCSGGPNGSTFAPAAGQVVWVFVHADVAKDSTGTLTANFVAGGPKTADSYVQGGIKYAITTDQDTLHNFSDTIEGGQLTLSHTCYATTTTTTSSSSSTSTSASTTTSDTTSASTTSTADTTSTTSTADTTSSTSTTSTADTTSTTSTADTTSTASTSTSATTASTSASTSTSSTSLASETTSSGTTTAATTQASTTTSGTGTVEAETGTPDVTPPSTDTGSISGDSSPSGGSVQLLLMVMAGLLAGVLLLTPAASRKR